MKPPNFTRLKTGDNNALGIWQWSKQHLEELSKWSAAVSANVTPTGSRMPWHAGAPPPPGWLAEDGALMETASYPALFAVIGYTYGGSGTMFKLPTTSNVIKY